MVVIGAKFVVLSLVSIFPYEKLSAFAFSATDSSSYYYPALTSLSNLEWSRMPGYSIIVRMAHLVSNTYFYDVVVFFQIMVSLLLVVIAAFVLTDYLTKRWAYVIVFLLAANPFLAFFDLKILSESLSTNFLVISVLLLVYKRAGFFVYFLSGLALMLSFSIRPTAVIFIPFAFVFLWFVAATWKHFVRYFSVFLLGILLFQAFWIPFNYKRFNQIIFLTKTELYSHYYDNFITYFLDLSGNYGGRGKENHITDPEPEDIRVFLPPFLHKSFKAPFEVKDFYTDAFNPERLKLLEERLVNCRSCYGKENLEPGIWEKEVMLRNDLFQEVKNMSASVKKEHPFKSHVLAKLIPLSFYVSQDLNFENYVGEPAFYYFEPRNNFDKYLRAYWNLFYSTTFILGFLGLVIGLFSKKRPIVLIAFVGGALLLVYPLVFRFSEWRYMHNALPFLMIGVVITLSTFQKLLYRYLPMK